MLLDVLIKILLSNSLVVENRLLRSLSLLTNSKCHSEISNGLKGMFIIFLLKRRGWLVQRFPAPGATEPTDVCSQSSLRCLIKVIRSHR